MGSCVVQVNTNSLANQLNSGAGSKLSPTCSAHVAAVMLSSSLLCCLNDCQPIEPLRAGS